MSSFSKKLFQQIPEAFYDLLGRMLPGGIVVATAIKVHGIAIDIDSEVLVFALSVELAYASGLAISAFAHSRPSIVLVCRIFHFEMESYQRSANNGYERDHE